MTTIARRHTLFGLLCALAGMGLGILMASTHDHSQHVTHAHLLLLGTVMSLLYASVCRLWLPEQPSRLAQVQLLLHQIGTLVLVGALHALYGRLLPEAALGPLLGLASICVLGAAALMLLMFVQSGRRVASTARALPAQPGEALPHR